MKKTNNSGFSLVELIIVIAIMAVLIGVLAPQFIKYVESSRQSTDMQNVQELKTAIETYVAENGEEVTGDITITLDGTNATVSGDMDADALDEVGIAASTKLKSTGWSGKATYSATSYKWTTSDGLGKNSKKPEKDMSGIFTTAGE